MKTNAYKNATDALSALQEFTKVEYPVGTPVQSRRGRGMADFTVTGYPTPDSLDTANSVIGESKNGKFQILDLANVVKVDPLSQVPTAAD